MDTVTWSATTCDFPGAGVYLGLAPDYEHLAVARSLGHKQARVFVGARMRLNGSDRPCPVNYYAIRDPSSVRIVPVTAPPLPGGFRHVELRFQMGRNGTREALVIVPPGNGAAAPPPLFPAAAGFLVSVGLPIPREQWFFDRLVLANRNGPWSSLFERLGDECRAGK